MSDKTDFKDMNEFWPFYVGEHKEPLNRALHFIGTSNFIFWLTTAIVRRDYRFVFLAIFLAYGFAWTGHFFVEKNRPATFRYPLKSLVGDFKMYAKIWQRQMEKELAQIKN